jgi:hypothetical protein
LAWCLDTSFLIDFLRGDDGAVSRARQLEDLNERKYVPAPAAYELLEGALNRGGHHISKALALLDTLEVISTDLNIASEAARIGSEGRKLGYTIVGVDVLFAATARANNLVLLTRDTAFNHVHGLAVEHY